jgi:hypothetical protein
MPAPIKHAKDSERKPTGPSETTQVKQLLRIEDRPAPGPGKKPIQHPTYKQIRDAIVVSAKQRAVYSVKSPGYVDLIKDLVHGNSVPYLNYWIPHWQDRESPDTEGENFYSHLSWLVQDVIKNMKAGIKRDRKKEGGEEVRCIGESIRCVADSMCGADLSAADLITTIIILRTPSLVTSTSHLLSYISHTFPASTRRRAHSYTSGMEPYDRRSVYDSSLGS